MKYCKILGTSSIYIAFILNIVATQEFPKHFKFGTATASHQIEGAWNEDGKCMTNWNYFEHNVPNSIEDNSTADVACDSYHKYKEDIQLLKELGVSTYRFSISWCRILPSGYINKINPLGLKYYNNIINELIANNIEPIVTIFHWDLPWNLQQLGGWTNEIIIDYYLDYVKVLFDNFGDRVKLWITINEPKVLCVLGYGGLWAPGLNASAIADYVCGHNVLKAHAEAYHLYQEEYKAVQKGRVGITLDSFWYEPQSEDLKDIEATKRWIEYNLGWFANPVLSNKGNYPQVMIDQIAEASQIQGFQRSRLPKFTKKEIDRIRGTFDFLGLNYYTMNLVQFSDEGYSKDKIHLSNDAQVSESKDPKWVPSAAPWLTDNPNGLRSILKHIKEKYNSPEIMITENGFADNGEHCDIGRMKYTQGHLKAVIDAILLDYVNVTAYYAWALLDDFEWGSGYTLKFGLHHVDFEDPNRPRSPKKSTTFYKSIIKQRRITTMQITEDICETSFSGGVDHKPGSPRFLNEEF